MSDWIEYLGRFHIAIIHFPIGLLITAAIVEVFASVRRFQSPTVTAVIMTGFGALAAVIASGLGWIRANDVNHPGAENIVELHRWAGIIAAVVASITFGVGWAALRGRVSLRWPFRSLLFITAILIALAGHLGGALIYGDDYYSLPGTEAAADDEDHPEE